jgi:hypothetical protein
MLGVAAALAVGGTTAASANNDPGAGTSTAPGRANRCERLGKAVKVLDDRVETRLEARIARIEAKIASGDLTDTQEARARKLLAHLQHRLEKLQALVDRLEAKLAEKCAAQTG